MNNNNLINKNDFEKKNYYIKLIKLILNIINDQYNIYNKYFNKLNNTLLNLNNYILKFRYIYNILINENVNEYCFTSEIKDINRDDLIEQFKIPPKVNIEDKKKIMNNKNLLKLTLIKGNIGKILYTNKFAIKLIN